jgi:hypothetical protein
VIDPSKRILVALSGFGDLTRGIGDEELEGSVGIGTDPFYVPFAPI